MLHQGPKWCFGTVGSHRCLFGKVWEGEHHVFAAEGTWATWEAPTQALGHPERVPLGILNLHPVETLAIDEGMQEDWPHDHYWTKWLDWCDPANKPAYIFLVAPPQELVLDHGLQSKSWHMRFQWWGYEPQYWFLWGHKHGRVVRQDQCLLILRWASQPPLPMLEPAPIAQRYVRGTDVCKKNPLI